MKKNVLLLALVVVAIGACTGFLPDGPTYLVIALMALAVLGLMQANKSRGMKLTRWAKANPQKAQWFIAGIQLALMALGILAGYNLNELGYRFSDATAYIFSAILMIGFLSVPFRPKAALITIPNEVNSQRLVYLGMVISSLVMMAFFGNRIESTYPQSPVTRVVQHIDQFIFSENTVVPISELLYKEQSNPALAGNSTAMPVFASLKVPGSDSYENTVLSDNPASKKIEKANKKAERKAKRELKKELRKKLRLVAAAGSCGLAIFLIVLLVIPLCGGICLFIFGVSGEAGVAGIIFGPIIAALSIWAMVKLAKWCKKDNG